MVLLDPVGLEKLTLLGIPVVRDEVTGVVHRDERLVAVTMASGKQIEADAAWVAMRWKATSDLAASLCDVDAVGLAKVDANGKTSRPGLFAVGNAANPVAHVAHATAEGTNVGPHVSNYLLDVKLAEIRSRRRPSPRSHTVH